MYKVDLQNIKPLAFIRLNSIKAKAKKARIHWNSSFCF